MSAMAFTYDEPQALAANAFTREGYTFAGWNTKADLSGTSFEDKLSVENLTTVNGETVYLYAMWSKGVPQPGMGNTLAQSGDATPVAALSAIVVCAAIALCGIRRIRA